MATGVASGTGRSVAERFGAAFDRGISDLYAYLLRNLPTTNSKIF
jgi:hypothetical protein